MAKFATNLSGATEIDFELFLLKDLLKLWTQHHSQWVRGASGNVLCLTFALSSVCPENCGKFVNTSCLFLEHTAVRGEDWTFPNLSRECISPIFSFFAHFSKIYPTTRIHNSSFSSWQKIRFWNLLIALTVFIRINWSRRWLWRFLLQQLWQWTWTWP